MHVEVEVDEAALHCPPLTVETMEPLEDNVLEYVGVHVSPELHWVTSPEQSTVNDPLELV